MKSVYNYVTSQGYSKIKIIINFLIFLMIKNNERKYNACKYYTN